MQKPQIPNDEQERLASLETLKIVYTPAEQRFDRITRLACVVFNVPIALVSLVTQNTQWFKSAQGLSATETPREISFCGHTILKDDALVIPDTSLDPRFADNPLVTGEPFIRFYAGQPISFDGRKMGTLCLIDRVPRQLLPSELDTLRSLAAWVENELKLSALSQTQTDLLRELDETRRAAWIDPLTKVWNRTGMDTLLPREIAHARLHKQPFRTCRWRSRAQRSRPAHPILGAAA
jgi:GAF domain-containing protein